MASSNDNYLCNGVPVDHRLKRFLSSAKRQLSQGVGRNADIVESFGNSMVRDDKTVPAKNEASFASWLAKPDMHGGLVIALLQPAKSQVYAADFQRVKNECPTLAYLEEALAFVNGSGSLSNTSVFDACPFITEPISSDKLSKEATKASSTFFAMLEAKRPKVVFACWRVNGNDLPFSGEGVGSSNSVHIDISDGRFVHVVNGFHPSYAANFCSNESCFRRLFAMELCKAFCELNSAWQEAD